MGNVVHGSSWIKQMECPLMEIMGAPAGGCDSYIKKYICYYNELKIISVDLAKI